MLFHRLLSPTVNFTRDYVIILRTTDILFGRLGGMRFLPPTVAGRCFRWGAENTSANLHSKFARCTVTFRGLGPRRDGDSRRGGGTEEGRGGGRLFADPYRADASLTPAFRKNRGKKSVFELVEREMKFVPLVRARTNP